MHIILIFYQFLPNFPNFNHFDLIFGLPLFFPKYFQLLITYHVPFILEYHDFIFFYVFFLFQNANTKCYQFLPIFLIFDHFDLIFGPPLWFSKFFSIGNYSSCALYSRKASFYIFKMQIIPIFNNFCQLWQI